MRHRSRWVLKGGKLKAHIVEEDVVEEITTRLWLQYRIKVWRVRERIPGAWALSVPGIPDLMGWLPKSSGFIIFGETTPRSAPVPLFIEVKRPGGVRRTAQTLFIEGAKLDGCVAFFADCWADVVREMSEQCGIKLKEAV